MSPCSDEVLPRSNYPRRFYLRSNKEYKINASIACSDRTNEVEPRPNEGFKVGGCGSSPQ
ncbi:MAG: hypothetical protein LBG80_07865 [Bacteroidales bacterium]|nr:hypothetical protein [Bacteroidales bacterium]